MKVFKKGNALPVKDLRGKIEVLDIVEIIEDQDIGTYIIEFTNTSRYIQDMSFIIKQIPLEGNKVAIKSANEELNKKIANLSKEEQRVYHNLVSASHNIKSFEVEQAMQNTRINHFLEN